MLTMIRQRTSKRDFWVPPYLHPRGGPWTGLSRGGGGVEGAHLGLLRVQAYRRSGTSPGPLSLSQRCAAPERAPCIACESRRILLTRRHCKSMVSDAPASSREDGSASASPICPSPERSASLISSSISCRVCHGPASCADRETHARSRKHLVLEQFPQACVQRRPNHGPGLRGASWDLLGRSADSLPKSAETSAAPRYPLRSLSNSLNARRTSASVMRPSQSDITETYRELALPTDFSRPASCPCDSHLPAGCGSKTPAASRRPPCYPLHSPVDG
jgi:hypothetical protein